MALLAATGTATEDGEPGGLTADTLPRRVTTSGAASFHTTRWSLVTRAAGAGEAARAALGDLLAAYWQPLYVWLRRRGHGPEDAADLVQGLFARWIEKQELAQLDKRPERGRFRAFLLTAADHFAANQRDRAMAHKRGGGRTVVPLDSAVVAALEDEVLASHETPERLYLRHWARTVLAAAQRRLAQEFAARGRGAVFARIEGYLDADPHATPYAQVAQELGMTEGAVKVAVHRLRQRFGELLRDEVAQTLDSEAEVQDELAVLRSAFAR